MKGDPPSTTVIATATAAAVAGLFLLRPVFFRRKKKDKQVILITGASSGIGKATALQLLKEGHIVYGAARRVERMRDIEKAGGNAIQMDVCNQEQIAKAVARVLKEQNQRIDVLINNAGYPIYGALEVISMDEARRQFEVNLFGLAEITKAVLPTMRNQKSGTIVNVSSGAGKIYAPFGCWYHASKHAVEGFSDCCRLDLKQFGINVVIVEPGVIKTEILEFGIPNLLERSKDTVYEASVNNMVKYGSQMTKYGSDPSVVANTLSKAVNAVYPRRRYVAGATVRELLWIRNWLGDAIYDAIMLGMLK